MIEAKQFNLNSLGILLLIGATGWLLKEVIDLGKDQTESRVIQTTQSKLIENLSQQQVVFNSTITSLNASLISQMNAVNRQLDVLSLRVDRLERNP